MSAPSLAVLAIQAQQIANQIHALKEHVGSLHLSGDIDGVMWSACVAYLHAIETPIEMVRINLTDAANSGASVDRFAAVAADPRA